MLLNDFFRNKNVTTRSTTATTAATSTAASTATSVATAYDDCLKRYRRKSVTLIDLTRHYEMITIPRNIAAPSIPTTRNILIDDNKK